MCKNVLSESDLRKRAKEVDLRFDSWTEGNDNILGYEPLNTMVELVYSCQYHRAIKFLNRTWNSKIEGKDIFLREFNEILKQLPYSDYVLPNEMRNN